MSTPRPRGRPPFECLSGAGDLRRLAEEATLEKRAEAALKIIRGQSRDERYELLAAVVWPDRDYA